ncbi:protease inhibitor I42 family protein [Candidatus Falkowbacteria bacterium]|nr:protease inhibitor I42 family protein [Candidatus Falkowbacteria bacterium]
MRYKLKKILPVVLILFLALTISACKKKPSGPTEEEVIFDGVRETGLVLDISEKSGQSATTTPGDVLYIKLTGEAGSGNQWTVIAPTTGSFLMLKDHKATGLTDEAEGAIFTDEWWLKIEETGNFEIGFSYGVPGEEPLDFFNFNVISR